MKIIPWKLDFRSGLLFAQTWHVYGMSGQLEYIIFKNAGTYEEVKYRNGFTNWVDILKYPAYRKFES